jgi:predicted DNA-binding protein with PD1-like motif
MQYQEGSIGRVFALRLEDGDRLPDSLEAFAREKLGSSCKTASFFNLSFRAKRRIY